MDAVPPRVNQSLFNFPPEGPRRFTAADLIALLQMYNREFAKSSPVVDHTLKTRRDYHSAALDALSSDPYHKREIFRSWPRSPTGQNILPQNTIQGKETSNGIQLWGATMFDFYRVRRFPDLAGVSTISTGSKLMRWMKANGELDAAKDEIEWAEREDDPKVIEPYPVRLLVEKQEEDIKDGKVSDAMHKKAEDNEFDHDVSRPSPS
jgi:hypothetical protein